VTANGRLKTPVRLLTIREVAQRLSVSRDTVERLIAAREVPAVRITRRKRAIVRVDAAALERCVEAWSEEFR